MTTSNDDPGRLQTLIELSEGLNRAWARGWNPLDFDRIFEKLPVDRYAFLAALAHNRRSWHIDAAPLWVEQADQLGAVQWWDDEKDFWPQFCRRHGLGENGARGATTLLSVILKDPSEQPLFVPPPSEPGSESNNDGSNAGILAKVRGLLAKAEASEFEHEAEAFSAKAQELIAKYSIDVAMLGDVYDVPGGVRVYIDDPYAKPKFILLGGIARANNCRGVWASRAKTATLVGHSSDLLLVEILFTSLLVQATNAVLSAGTQYKPDGRVSTRSWRNAFWFGYAARIEERLGDATKSAHDQHEADTGQDYLPVLAKRSEAVEQALSEAFPSLGTMTASMSNIEGLNAGRSFANNADLRSNSQVRSGGSPQLGS